MIVMGPFQYNILYDSMNLLYQVTGKHLQTIYDHTEKTLQANARRRVTHNVQQLVMPQSSKISHIHVWSILPRFFSLFCRLWEHLVVVELCRTVRGNKKQQLRFSQRFHQVIPYIVFCVVNLEKIVLFITQCFSWKCFCKSGYKLKSICELQIVTSLWNFTQFHYLKDHIRQNLTEEDQTNNFLQRDDVGSRRYQ